MPFTKKQIRDWVLDECAATQGVRFDSNPGGIVDHKIGGAHDRLWADLLNATEPGVLRGGIRDVTANASGLIPRASLTDVTNPDTAERLYRIISVDVQGHPYSDETRRAADLTRVWKNAAAGTQTGIQYGARAARAWWVFGDSIYLFPIPQEGTPATVICNHRPTRFDQLSGEGVAVEFPDGYEQILAYRGAAEVLMKGSEETQASLELRAAAEPLWEDMMSDLGRPTTAPDRVRYEDDRSDWGA